MDINQSKLEELQNKLKEISDQEGQIISELTNGNLCVDDAKKQIRLLNKQLDAIEREKRLLSKTVKHLTFTNSNNP